MDIKKVDELLRMKGNCAAATDTLIIELLSVIANNTSRLVQIEENKLHGQMELDLRPKPTTESKETFTKKVEEKVEEAMEKVEPVEVKKPAPKKKAAPKKPAEPTVEVKAEPVPVAEKKLPTKEEVMKELVAYIGENGEAALATVLKDLGNFTNFPSVPQEKYEDLLNAIK